MTNPEPRDRGLEGWKAWWRAGQQLVGGTHDYQLMTIERPGTDMVTIVATDGPVHATLELHRNNLATGENQIASEQVVRLIDDALRRAREEYDRKHGDADTTGD